MVIGILFCVISLSSASFPGILTWSVGIIALSCVCISGLLFDGLFCEMWEILFRYWMMMGSGFWVFVFCVPLIVTLLLTSFCPWIFWCVGCFIRFVSLVFLYSPLVVLFLGGWFCIVSAFSNGLCWFITLIYLFWVLFFIFALFVVFARFFIIWCFFCFSLLVLSFRLCFRFRLWARVITLFITVAVGVVSF